MRVGSIGYATDQGLGHLLKWFYDRGIVDDVMVYRHGSRTTHMEWYPEGTVELVGRPFTGPDVDRFIDTIDTVLFFETPFDWQFPGVCRKRGVKTVMMPMHEWFPRRPPHDFDVYLCPSLLDQEYFLGHPFLPVPVDPGTWRLHTEAKRFLHNAGNVGHRHHKGTAEVIQALPLLDESVDFTIRCQDTPLWNRLAKLYPQCFQDVRCNLTVETGTIPYEQLFVDHDVYVAPEKLNGLSLPLQEACAAGLAVMASNRFPANTWLPSEPLIPVETYHKAAIGPGYLPFQEAVVSPQAVADKINAWNGRDVTEYSQYGRRWAEENCWEALKPRYREVLAP